LEQKESIKRWPIQKNSQVVAWLDHDVVLKIDT
jgi:hypothetical protein